MVQLKTSPRISPFRVGATRLAHLIGASPPWSPRPRRPTSIPRSVGGPIAAAGALAIGLGLLYFRSALLGQAIGAAACAVACGWRAQRAGDERPVWLALAAACGAWGLAAAALALGYGPRGGGLGALEIGLFAFSVGAGTAQVAWPEIRRSTQRLMATLADAVIVVAALAVWGSAGFPPFGSMLPSGALSGVVGSGELALPLVAAAMAYPQLPSARQARALALAAAMSALFVGSLLSGSGAVAWVVALGWAAESVGFAALFWQVAFPRPGMQGSSSAADGEAAPPFPWPGLLGIVVLVGAATGVLGRAASTPGLAAVLAVGLAGREVLRVLERRAAREQLAASVDLEGRLLRLQAEAGPGPGPREALRRSCQLATEVLRTDAALAWLAEDRDLVLEAVAPQRREGLLGRRLPLAGGDSLASRVFHSGQPEVVDASAAALKLERFLCTVFDAGPLLGEPIVRERAAIGVLVLIRRRGRPAFSVFDQQKAALIAAEAAGALRRLELYDEQEAQLREATLVHRFAVQAMSAQNTHDVAWALLESIRSRLPIARGAVCLVDRGGRGVTPIAHYLSRSARVAKEETTHVQVSIQSGGTVVGYVELYPGAGEQFRPQERRLLEALAHQAAVSIQNLRLQEESGKVTTYRELDRLKTDLLSAVSHDLRGPLTNIKGYASKLSEEMRETPLEEQIDYLRTIEGEADRLHDLLEHLLDLSRIQAGGLRVDLQPVRLGRIVEQTIASVAGPPHRHESHVPGDVLVMADGRRMRQVLHNLLENAAKYSPEGGSIIVNARTSDSEVEISVSDEGVGIPRHQWDRIFRPYQRADTALRYGIKGTGLGLAICKGIIEAHGGRIWVESEPGLGSTFHFTLARGPSVGPID